MRLKRRGLAPKSRTNFRVEDLRAMAQTTDDAAIPAELAAWAGPIKPPNPAELADRYALMQLCRGYALGVDMRCYPLSRSMFAKDAYAEGSVGPRAPIDDYLPKVYGGAAAFAATQHNMTNQYVAVNGDTAVVWSYAIAYHWVKEGEDRPDLVMGVQYRDQCRRFPEGWQITERKVVKQWGHNPAGRKA